MIDFVRMNYHDKSGIEAFVCNEENFPEIRMVLERHSGAIEYPFKTNLKTMDITITEKRVCLMNSLHKLNNYRKNSLNMNHNDFKYSEIVENIDFLDNSMLNIHKSTLSKLEFGLNIELDYPAEYIIDNNIIMHKHKVHNHNNKFDGRGAYKQFDHSNYDFKIYDKGKQYKLRKNVIRFEIKHKRSKSFNPYGAYNIHHLKSKDCLHKLFDDLMKRFDELMIIDNYKNNPNISESTVRNIEKYTSYNYWELLSSREKRNLKSIEKKRFNMLLENNNLLTTKNELRTKLQAKFNFLINN